MDGSGSLNVPVQFFRLLFAHSCRPGRQCPNLDLRRTVLAPFFGRLTKYAPRLGSSPVRLLLLVQGDGTIEPGQYVDYAKSHDAFRAGSILPCGWMASRRACRAQRGWSTNVKSKPIRTITSATSDGCAKHDV